MPRHAHLKMAAAALDEVFHASKPADAVLRELFARHRNAGSRDRATISEYVYGVLRNAFVLRFLLGEAAPALALVEAYVQRRHEEPLPALDDATRHNLPRWLWDALVAQYGADASALAQALNRQATVDLRVNALKATRDAAIASLRADGIEATPTPLSPVGLRLAKREALQRTRAFREGLVEPQDEGSQLLAPFTQARAGEVVADVCAGAGGKSLALAAQMRDRGKVHAFDVSRERLQRLTPRLQRAGLSSVAPQPLRNERDPRLAALARQCDAVLVDAPCSATGTLRRNPELRLREPDLPALAGLQLRILAAAAELVKPGGRLVYATCSVLRAENQDVVGRFLSAHPAFARDDELVLLPHRDGTDGFYAARLISSSAPRPIRTRP